MATFTLSKKETAHIESILKKQEAFSKKSEPKKLTFAQLKKLLTKDEYAFVEKIVAIKPKTFGVNYPYYGIAPVLKNFVALRNQKYVINKEKKTILPQYLPKNVYMSYLKLNRALKKDIKKQLLVASGYRSPAYQAVLFIRNLAKYDFDFKKVIREVAVPGYSEHGSPTQQALDFLTVDGAPSERLKLKFEKTPEYAWLLKRAGEFGFYLSYQKNNKEGIIFEPWHWSFRGSATKAAK